MTANASLYLLLWDAAQARPRQYRAGIECRMRRLWTTMTPADRAALAAY